MNTGNFADCELAWTNFDTAVRKYDFLYNGMIKDVSERTEERIHPTQKPINLLQRIIEIFTDKGDVVIDPCAGSGSTLRAAHDLKRPSYGFEIDRNICALANGTMLNFENEQITLF